MRSLPPVDDPRLLIGSATADDAGVVLVRDDLALVQTVDFFTPIVDDPYDFGRIAAANALSDIYAMGAEPLSALNLVAFPLERLGPGVLREILRGGGDVVREAGALLVGGHSIDDPEPKYGLAVTGTVDPARVLSNAGGRAGDALVLTKPLGVGAISTALKRGHGDVAARLRRRHDDRAERGRGARCARCRRARDDRCDRSGHGQLHARPPPAGWPPRRRPAGRHTAGAAAARDGAASGSSRRIRRARESFSRFAADVEEWHRRGL